MRRITLRELCGLVDRTSGKKLPTAKALRQSDSAIVATAAVGHDGELTVYQSGFFLYRASGKVTVGAVDRCGGYAYDGGDELDEATFEDEAWTVRLALAGEDRIEHNMIERENSHADFFFKNNDDDESVPIEMKLAASGDFAEDIANRDALRRMLARLTDKQRQVVEMRFICGMTQQQIADQLGIRKQVICRHLQAAEEKFEKFR